jgi:hypothetical protein
MTDAIRAYTILSSKSLDKAMKREGFDEHIPEVDSVAAALKKLLKKKMHLSCSGGMKTGVEEKRAHDQLTTVADDLYSLVGEPRNELEPWHTEMEMLMESVNGLLDEIYREPDSDEASDA